MREPYLSRDDAFAERIAKPLRSPEFLRADFEQRLMARLPDKPPLEPRLRIANAPPPSWWHRRHSFSFTPLGALAAAAVFAVVTIAGAITVSRMAAPDAARMAAASTVPAGHVTLVRFVFVDPEAQSVSLVGDFNKWARGKTVLKPDRQSGVWSISLPLDAGRHEYAFIVNGVRWVADPLASTVSDEFGTVSSEVWVDPDHAASPAGSSSSS